MEEFLRDNYQHKYISMKVRVIEGTIEKPEIVTIVCTACDREHKIWIVNPGSAEWGFNLDYEKPTFTPSLKVQYVKYENGFDKWMPGDKFEKVICHSVITDGIIHYCDDCTHEMRGDVPLPDVHE